MPILFLIVVIDLIGFGVIIPLLPFYAEYYQATPFQIGLLMASYSASQFLAAAFWGRLSDRIGRRPVLLFSIAGSAVAYTWLGFAETLTVLFAARIMGGFMAGNLAAAFAYVADVTTKENRAKGMGMMGAAFSVGFIFGPALGGILAGADAATADFRTPSFVAAGLSAIACILGLFFLKESLSDEIRARQQAMTKVNRMRALMEALSQPGIRLLIMLSFLSTLVFAGLEAIFAIWSLRQFDWGPQQNGYLFAFIGVIAAIIQGGFIGKLTARFGTERLIVGGSVGLAIGLAFTPLARTELELIIAMAVASFGFSILSPALNTAISIRGEADVQGGLFGVTRSATTLSRVFGPVLAGGAFAVFGLNSPYVFGATAMLMVAALSLYFLIVKKSHNGAKNNPEMEG